MPDTLTIPQTPPDLDPILDRMGQREDAKGDPRAVGKSGERGLWQVKPNIAQKYGVNPDLLFNPIVNRYVAKRYLSDLVGQFGGDVRKAVAAYNAGPGNVAKGNIPDSTKRYVAFVTGEQPRIEAQPGGKIMPAQSDGFSFGKLFGEGTANAAEAYTGPLLEPPKGYKSKFAESSPSAAPSSPSIPAAPPTPASPLSPWTLMAPSPPLAGGKPMTVPDAASYLPMVGQFVGETGGGLVGAAIPGLGETGALEYAGAVSGGAGGSALGAEAENAIRKRYGLPPVSVGGQAAWGALGSGVGGLVPGVMRYRKAAAVARSTGMSFAKALDYVKNIEAGLEGTIGMGPRVAKLSEDNSSAAVKGAYYGARKQALDEIGSQYDTIFGADAHKLTPRTALQQVQGGAGKILDLTGQGMRQSLEDEFAKSPMTVARVQRLISFVKARQRLLNRETQGYAIGAYDDIIKALQADRDAVIGPTKAAAVKVVDGYYARQMARFPIKPGFQKMTTETGAAEAILEHKPSEVGRTLQVIRDMERTGNIAALRRATASRIYQAAKVGEQSNPIARIDKLVTAVKKIEPEVFDELYGVGAQKQWLETAAAITKRQRELLEHPDQARAVAAAVRGYLQAPGMMKRVASHFLQHRLLFAGLMGATFMETGAKGVAAELAVIGGSLLGIEGYEMAMHNRFAMRLLEKAAQSKEPQIAAKLIVSAMSTAIRGAGEKDINGTVGGEDASGK